MDPLSNTNTHQSHKNSHAHNSPALSQKTILTTSIALNTILILSLGYTLSQPKISLEDQVKQITQANKSSSEALTKIKNATSWDSLKK